ncbi:MAG: DEAD/DEAH box helicase family protein [Bilifractor sp.]
MAERDYKEDGTEKLKLALDNAITGGYERNRFLLYYLLSDIQRSERIDFIVSFLMESGVRMLIRDLQTAVDRGVPVRILTGNYLNITQPSALYLLKDHFGDRVDLRFYNEQGRSFHAKAYIFHFPGGEKKIYVGSSNVSRSALTNGIEWNYSFTNYSDPGSYNQFFRTFEDLFYHHAVLIDDAVLRQYSKNWHRPAVYHDLERYDRENELFPETINPGEDGDKQREIGTDGRKTIPIFQPRGAQIEALYELRRTREEGADKALVQAATGIGKTYLAAFDSLGFHRVLFVAHREEILKQAMASFHNVRPNDSEGFFGNGEKDTKSALVFASEETLGKPAYLREKYFHPDDFDYLVIDEFHHAVTDGYRNIIHYFHPKFMLGLTATPERMDGRDIYELCDYNVPYELSLRDAINKGFLCPFHYYGIYDDTDYSQLHLVKGHYTEKDLNAKYIGNAHRYDLIYDYYTKYVSKRALGFCCSRQHAEDMAREFNSRGIPSAAVYSGTEQGPNAMERSEALKRLRDGEIRIIFSVDMFNEGLDVPSVDMVLFLRPTESPVVFLQQLGRGLRRADGKEYLNVLDFIGNYERAGQAPSLLTGHGDRGGRRGGKTGEQIQTGDYPDGCIVDFDMRLINLFHLMQRRSQSVSERIDAEVDRVRDLLGRIPTRMDLFTNMDEEVYRFCLSHTKDNPFRNYLEYKRRRGWLTREEGQVMENAAGKGFLKLVAQTAMTKVYKMPILLTFYNDGKPIMAVTDEQVLTQWKRFFNQGTNWKDFDPKLTREQYLEISDREHLKKAHSMPIHFLLKSGGNFFVEKEGYALALCDDLKPMMTSHAFISHFGDIVRYRTVDYYRRRYVDKDTGKLLFSMKVNKSLLNYGWAVPEKYVDQLFNDIHVSLDKGQSRTIQIELDGTIYFVKLMSLNFGEKYADQRRIQIRYGSSSEICQKFNELFCDDLEKGIEREISVYAAGTETLRIEY